MSQQCIFIKPSLKNLNNLLIIAGLIMCTGNIKANTLDDEAVIVSALYPEVSNINHVTNKVFTDSFPAFDEGAKPWTQEQVEQMQNSFRMFQSPAMYPSEKANDDSVSLWEIAQPLPIDQPLDKPSVEATNPYMGSLEKVKHISDDTLNTEYAPLIEKYAKEANLEPKLISLIIKFESNFNHKIVSPKGAKGLMQLMDSVSETYGIQDPFEPEENIKAGVAYFASLMKRYNNDTRLALAAYNAGPGAVAKYKGVPPYKETQNYVANILLSYNKLTGETTNQVF